MDNIFYASYKQAKHNFRRIQRHAIEHINQQFYTKLHESAEIDSTLFWKHVRSRRKKPFNLTSSLKKDGVTIRDPIDIADAFSDYYADVFQPKDLPNYNKEHLQTLNENVHEFINSNDFSDDPILTRDITMDELQQSIKHLNKGKASGPDNVKAEHIIYGGDTLHTYLLKLFRFMMYTSYVPDLFKKGIIVPIHKDGKSTSDTSGYRPITLLSVIYKLFERILHDRLSKWNSYNNNTIPNAQQQAYQKLLGPTTTSFNLQETVLNCVELNSSVYAAFLDTAGAFDNVRHSALFVKMRQIGIKGKFLRLLINSHEGLKASVLVNCIYSKPFNILHGVRQGGIMSSWSYLLFINDLLNQLETINSLTVGNINCGNPTLADDLALLCPNLTSLENQLQIACNYANNWGYCFNTAKCKFIVFGKQNTSVNSAKFGNSSIEKCETVTHVGIALNRLLNSSDAVTARVRKGYASMHSLLALRNQGHVNPTVMSSLLQTISISSALYGCELWHNMSPKDVQNVEKLWRSCAKKSQYLPVRTRTDMALSLLGWHPIESEIDKRKLTFLQRLCNMPSKNLSKQLFLYRLNLYFTKQCKNQYGFIPDIYRILKKYTLSEYLTTYQQHNYFPEKRSWKNIVQKAIGKTFEISWKERTKQDIDFDRFCSVHDAVQPSLFWKCANTNQTIKHAISAVELLTCSKYKKEESSLCNYCESIVIDVRVHMISDCSRFSRQRDNFINNIEQHCSEDLSIFLRTFVSRSEAFARHLLNTKLPAVFGTDNTKRTVYIQLCIQYIHRVLKGSEVTCESGGQVDD